MPFISQRMDLDNLMKAIQKLPDELEEKIMSYAHYMAFKPINYEIKYRIYGLHYIPFIKKGLFAVNRNIKRIHDDNTYETPRWEYVFEDIKYQKQIRKRIKKSTSKDGWLAYGKVIIDSYKTGFEK